MNNDLLLSLKRHKDTLIEKTNTKPQETPEFELNRQMQFFSFNAPIKNFEEGK